MTPSRAYAPQLSALRGLAIIGVLYTHLYASSSVLGHPGVGLFFVLSGFLITDILLSIKEDGQPAPAKWLGIRNFHIRRALRIWPLYFLLVGLAVAVDFQGMRSVAAWHALFASNILFAIRGAYIPWTTAAWWTLSVVEQFYLLWPFAIMLLDRRAIPWLIAGLIVSGLAFQAAMFAAGLVSPAASLLLPASFHSLGAGALLAWVWRRDQRFPDWLPSLGIVAALASLLVRQFPDGGWIADSVAVIAMAALVAVAFVGARGPIGWLLDLAPLQFLGRISFGVYLVHGFVAWALFRIAASFPAFSHPGPLVFVVGSAISIVIATASWIGLEAPINRLKRRFPYRARARVEVGSVASALS
jgi:peptidoglycan/LPS O-acetylase OafA/YrhL